MLPRASPPPPDEPTTRAGRSRDGPGSKPLRWGRNVLRVQRVWLRDVALASVGLTAAAALAACGRRATEADCRLIVDRSVELQMKEMSRTTPSAIEQRAEQVRGELGDEIKACEGRRVTDKTVSCVQAASTSMDLDKCLR
jgi:hypothetical protein